MTNTPKTPWLAAASLLSVFIIDSVAPPQFVVDILYLCSILIVFKRDTRTIIGFSVAACALIVINMLQFKPVHFDLSLYMNRSVSVLAIFITAYIAVNYQKQAEIRMLKEQQYSKALLEMLFMTSHEVRKPVANILGLVEDIANNATNTSMTDLQSRCMYLQRSAQELDKVIKKLNTFIEETKKKAG